LRAFSLDDVLDFLAVQLTSVAETTHSEQRAECLLR
jgi:hypothetical protein